MATKTKLNFGVENPITIDEPREYDWFAWKIGKAEDTYLGLFRDAAVALAWKATQKEGTIVINNVPPTTSRHYARRDNPYVKRVRRPQQATTAPAPAPKPVKVRKPLTPEQIALRDAAQAKLGVHAKAEAEELDGEN